VSIAEPTQAEVAVFDLSGRRVATIQRGVLPAGTSNLEWNGRRADGSRAAGGIYFYRLTSRTASSTDAWSSWERREPVESTTLEVTRTGWRERGPQ